MNVQSKLFFKQQKKYTKVVGGHDLWVDNHFFFSRNYYLMNHNSEREKSI